MSTQQHSIEAPIQASNALFGLLDRLEEYLTKRVKYNAHWDTRSTQVNKIAEDLLSDKDLLDVAGDRVNLIITRLRAFPTAPADMQAKISALYERSLEDLGYFEAAIEEFEAKEFGERLLSWFRKVEGEFYTFRSTLPIGIQKPYREIARRTRKLIKLAKCEVSLGEEDD